MKKWLFGTSLILIIAGLIAVSSACTPVETDTSMSVAKSNDSWSVSANLTEGDRVWVHTTQGLDWPYGVFDIDDENPYWGVLWVGVNITDPRGNMTLFYMKYVKDSSEEQRPLSLGLVNITTNQGGLDPTPLLREWQNNVTGEWQRSYWYVGGIAQFNGTYKFTVGMLMPSREYPPSTMDIRKYIKIREYPLYLLPIGIPLTVIGATTTWFSSRKKSKPKSIKAKIATRC